MRAALIPALLLVALCSGPAFAQKARSEALDLDDKDRALVAKEAVKQSREQKRNSAAGKSGNSGWSTGPHLHFMVMQTCGSWYCISGWRTAR